MVTAYDRIEAIQKDPSASFWIKKASLELLDLDPVDDLNDLEYLVDIFKQHLADISASVEG